MGWTAPRTWLVGEVVTAGVMNTHIRDNLIDLNSRATMVSNTLVTAQTRSVTTFGDLATVGPSVTLVTHTLVEVMLSVAVEQNTDSSGGLMSFAVSGASTIAADNVRAVGTTFQRAADKARWSDSFILTVTPGSNTFTGKYRTQNSGTASFDNRTIKVRRLN